ncbi:WAS/WASL-interacting protein family member 3-like [Cyanistes caeruleus]|uniref:WAS/WASL-interacting protein family member 3-like n=1 Tax=Cyanistes caeruleus TaxID=156563 RepID=UPI000CDB6FDA|nr:WAS/WASL-interacting protein family member 3-like [Cyanistes caeruleus]
MTTVTNGVPQPSVLRPILVDIFINDIDKGIKHIPRKSEDRKLRGMVVTPRSTAATTISPCGPPILGSTAKPAWDTLGASLPASYRDPSSATTSRPETVSYPSEPGSETQDRSLLEAQEHVQIPSPAILCPPPSHTSDYSGVLYGAGKASASLGNTSSPCYFTTPYSPSPPRGSKDCGGRDVTRSQPPCPLPARLLGHPLYSAETKPARDPAPQGTPATTFPHPAPPPAPPIPPWVLPLLYPCLPRSSRQGGLHRACPAPCPGSSASGPPLQGGLEVRPPRSRKPCYPACCPCSCTGTGAPGGRRRPSPAFRWHNFAVTGRCHCRWGTAQPRSAPLPWPPVPGSSPTATENPISLSCSSGVGSPQHRQVTFK